MQVFKSISFLLMFGPIFSVSEQKANADKAGFLEIQAAKIIVPFVRELLNQIPSTNQVEAKADISFFSTLEKITKAAVSFASTQVSEENVTDIFMLKKELAHLRVRLTQLSGTTPISLEQALKKLEPERNCVNTLIARKADGNDPNSMLSYFANDKETPSYLDKITSLERTKVYKDIQGLFSQGPRKVDDTIYFISQPQNRQKTIEFLSETENELGKLAQRLSKSLQKQWTKEKVDLQKKKGEKESQLSNVNKKYKDLLPQSRLQILLPEKTAKIDKELQALVSKRNQLETEITNLQTDITWFEDGLKRLVAPAPSWCEQNLSKK